MGDGQLISEAVCREPRSNISRVKRETVQPCGVVASALNADHACTSVGKHSPLWRGHGRETASEHRKSVPVSPSGQVWEMAGELPRPPCAGKVRVRLLQSIHLCRGWHHGATGSTDLKGGYPTRISKGLKSHDYCSSTELCFKALVKDTDTKLRHRRG